MKKLKKLIDFVSTRVFHLLLSGVALGLFVSIIELGFAATLQVFLIKLGVDVKDAPYASALMDLSLNQILLVVLLIGVCRALCVSAQAYLKSASVRYFQNLMCNRISNWCFSSAMVNSSKVMTLYNSDTTASGEFLSAIQLATIRLTSSFFLAVVMIKMAPITTIISFVVVAFLGLGLRFLRRTVNVHSYRLAKTWEDNNERILLSIKNLLLLQIYGLRSSELAKVRSTLDVQLTSFLSLDRIHALALGLWQFFAIAILCFIAYTAHKLQSMSPVVLVSYFYLFMRFSQGIVDTASSSSVWGLYYPQIRRLWCWWNENKESLLLGEKQSVVSEKAYVEIDKSIGIQMQSVSFSYQRDSELVVKNFSLNIDPGNVVVLLGPSGSGKSSIISLILGISSPSAGEILMAVGNNSFRPTDANFTLLKHVGYVGPEPFVVPGTIYDNLIYGLNKAPSETAINSALKHANCDFVEGLKQKLLTPLSEQGQGLSAGQKQRLALARALLRNPRLLILDEATANVDDVTEEKLIDTLSSLRGEMTIIAATHRKAILKIADKVVNYSQWKD